MIAQRKDLGVRVAGEKAHFSDEFITRSQLIPGTNITFTYLDNYDIKINAKGGTGTNAAGLRQLFIELIIDRELNNHEHFSADDKALPANETQYPDLNITEDTASLTNLLSTSDTEYASTNRKYFGSARSFVIHHNWNLAAPDMFHVTWFDKRKHSMKQSTAEQSNGIWSLPRITGVNTNSLIITCNVPIAHLVDDPTSEYNDKYISNRTTPSISGLRSYSNKYKQEHVAYKERNQMYIHPNNWDTHRGDILSPFKYHLALTEVIV